MSKHDDLNPDVFYQYLSGNAPSQVIDAVHQWVAEDGQRAQTLEELRQTLSIVQNRARTRTSVRNDIEAVAVLRAESEINQGISHDRMVRRNESIQPQKTASTQKYPWSGVSIGSGTKLASLIGIGACVAFLIAQLPIIRNITSGNHQGATLIEYVTAPAQQATLQLADGTVVELNVASRLTVAADRAGILRESQRVLNLSGNAAFSVVHNQSRPLVVRTAATRVTVLGTRFAIDAYTRDVRIAVESGKLSVSVCNDSSPQFVQSSQPSCTRQTKPTILGQNDVASFNTSGTVLHAKKSTELEREFAFTTGRLILADSSLTSMVDQLNRWYDIDIRIGDVNIGKRVLAGTFTRGTPEAFVKAISVLLDARIERQGRVITVYSKTKLSTQEAL